MENRESRPQAGNALTPAQLKAAAKVVRALQAQVDARLRRIEPPPDRESTRSR